MVLLRLSVFPMVLTSRGLLYLGLLCLLHASLWTAVDSNKRYTKDEIKIFMEKHGYNGTKVTYEQLVQWFKNGGLPAPDIEKDPIIYARLFSFCVTPKQIKDLTPEKHHLKKFHKIFKQLYLKHNIRPFYEFQNTSDGDTFATNKAWIKDLTVSRINTPESDMVNLRQWFHVKVETAIPLKGLYMQPIVGPLGIPFGEFSVEFSCKDDMGATKDIAEVGHITHCHYRPRTAISHPLIYVGVSDKGKSRFDMHYKWSDITCMESPYMQFLVIAVKEFGEPMLDNNYKPLLSPIYLNTKFDSNDGAPYPYYPEWSTEMNCFQTDQKNLPKPPQTPKTGADHKFSALHWVVSDKAQRIQPNEPYDLCIWHNDTGRDEIRLECPPVLRSQFQNKCDESYADLDKSGAGKIEKSRVALVDQENKATDCYPCSAPLCGEDIGFKEEDCTKVPPVEPEEEILIDPYVELIDNLHANIAVHSHGVIATLAALVLLPIASFMGRFYKEVCSDFLFGNGPWIFVHVGGHVVSLVIMWLSIGPVTPQLAEYESVFQQCFILLKNDTDGAKDCAYEKSLRNPHVVLGIIFFFFQHVILITGFCRAENKYIRGIQVIVHSQGGYVVYLLGAFASIMAVYSNPCSEFLLYSILLLVIGIVFFGVATVLDILTDKKLGITPSRKLWPILEPIKLTGKGPCTLLKWVVMGCMAGLMGFVWILLSASFNTSKANPDQVLLDIENFAKNETKKAVGLFGDCTGDQKLW